MPKGLTVRTAELAAAFFWEIKVAVTSVILLKQALWKVQLSAWYFDCRAKERSSLFQIVTLMTSMPSVGN